MKQLVLVAHNIRSAHNVGSLLRTADGLGAQVLLTGYTPYPLKSDDERLPHVANKLQNQISKTSLGAELLPMWKQQTDVLVALIKLRQEGYTLIGLEQVSTAQELTDATFPDKTALILGSEVTGIDASIQSICDSFVVIRMSGQKESLNVVQAAAIAMYEWRRTSKR